MSELRSVHEMPEEALAWVTKMIDYNVKGGKLNRGLAVRQDTTHSNKHTGTSTSRARRHVSSVPVARAKQELSEQSDLPLSVCVA